MNAGLTGSEIAEQLALPDVLAHEWYNRGYYGTMSHNSKAVYQRYMGWYDANPASLNPLPPVAAGKHYVEAMGGADAVIAKARRGERRPANIAGRRCCSIMSCSPMRTIQSARDKLADVYTQLGYQAEAGTWRNIYLTGAQELRHGVARAADAASSLDLIRATPTKMMLDFAAVRLNPERAGGKHIALNIVLSDVERETSDHDRERRADP